MKSPVMGNCASQSYTRQPTRVSPQCQKPLLTHQHHIRAHHLSVAHEYNCVSTLGPLCSFLLIDSVSLWVLQLVNFDVITFGEIAEKKHKHKIKMNFRKSTYNIFSLVNPLIHMNKPLHTVLINYKNQYMLRFIISLC